MVNPSIGVMFYASIRGGLKMGIEYEIDETDYEENELGIEYEVVEEDEDE